MNPEATPDQSPPLKSGEDWPYGFGMCCCGCGKKARVVGGVLERFYRKYHERWLLAKVQRESPPNHQSIEANYYPAAQGQQPLPENQQRSRPNKFAIAKHLPRAFEVTQSKINQVYADKDRGSPTASEREKQFPHLRGRISAVLKGRVKANSALRLLDCTLPELRAHLEKQFKPGMSWLNYGEWHVDHIRPCASFDFSEPTSLSQCFHYTNLQPMWGADNAEKNSRWEGRLIRRKQQG